MNENRVPENRRTETLEEQGFSSDRYERRAERRAERKARRDPVVGSGLAARC